MSEFPFPISGNKTWPGASVVYLRSVCACSTESEQIEATGILLYAYDLVCHQPPSFSFTMKWKKSKGMSMDSYIQVCVRHKARERKVIQLNNGQTDLFYYDPVPEDNGNIDWERERAREREKERRWESECMWVKDRKAERESVCEWVRQLSHESIQSGDMTFQTCLNIKYIFPAVCSPRTCVCVYTDGMCVNPERSISGITHTLISV